MEALIVANWKENKTVSQTTEWFEKFSNPKSQIPNNLEIVVCPSFVLIPILRSHLSPPTSHLSLGAQDVSKFEEGQYTGEVSAKMLKDFVDYVIVGHSERRKYFNETDEDVQLKIEQCLKYGLTPIICVSDLKQVSKVSMVSGVSGVVYAYEPLFAVGTGESDTPENAQKFAEKLKAEVGQDVQVLYGGSVNSENVKSFIDQPDISGVLVGEASLDAEEFARVCHEICRF